MATIRRRGTTWQVQVRRHGHATLSRTFRLKADADRWARQKEAEIDRGELPVDTRVLRSHTRVVMHRSRLRRLGNKNSPGFLPAALTYSLIACRVCQFEPDGLSGLLLTHRCAFNCVSTWGNVLDLEGDDIATT
jgi:hypothetical protein